MPNSNDGTCFECGFATTLRGGHCSGVINCEEEKHPCGKCKKGYELVQTAAELDYGPALVKIGDYYMTGKEKFVEVLDLIWAIALALY